MARRSDDETISDHFDRLREVEKTANRVEGKQASHEEVCSMRYAGIEVAIKGIKDNMTSLQYYGIRAVIGLALLILLGGHAFLKAALEKVGIQLP